MFKININMFKLLKGYIKLILVSVIIIMCFILSAGAML